MNPTNKQLRRAWALIAILFAASGIFAQEPSKYKTTEVESLRLQVAQKDAIIAQQQLQQVQQAYQNAIDKLHAVAEAIRVENKWADTVKFNDQGLTFFEPPKPETVKAPEKK